MIDNVIKITIKNGEMCLKIKFTIPFEILNESKDEIRQKFLTKYNNSFTKLFHAE